MIRLFKVLFILLLLIAALLKHMGSFPKEIRNKVLVQSARHCCVCHRYKGVKVEVHHIIPQSAGGTDDISNAIALCFDCHADAGHYNKMHPRGSKLGPDELQLARDTWYRKVEENNIEQPSENDYLHCRYLICRNFEILAEIANSDFSKIPIDNARLTENKTLQFQRFIAGHYQNKYRQIEYDIKRYPTIDDYLQRYPDALRVDRSLPGLPYYETKRTPNTAELLPIIQKDIITSLLHKKGIAIEKIAISLTKTAGECGDDEIRGYWEVFYVRPIWSVYLAVTNIANEYVTLDALYCMASRNFFCSYKEVLKNNGGQESVYPLPKMPLSPFDTVLVPAMTILAPFEHIPYEEMSESVTDADPDHFNSVAHVSYDDAANEKFDVLGPVVLPKKISLNIKGASKEQNFHELDLSNIYILDRYWAGGSCPHLFCVQADGRVSYINELLASSPNELTSEIINVPKTVNKIAIAELEDEETVIRTIRQGKEILVDGAILCRGDVLYVDVIPGKKAEVCGYYMPSINAMVHPLEAWQHNAIIGNYLSRMNANTPNGVHY